MEKYIGFSLFLIGLFIVLVFCMYLFKAMQKRRRNAGVVIGTVQTPSGIKFEIIADLFSVIGIIQ